jgi:hypothetical protein
LLKSKQKPGHRKEKNNQSEEESQCKFHDVPHSM